MNSPCTVKHMKIKDKTLEIKTCSAQSKRVSIEINNGHMSYLGHHCRAHIDIRLFWIRDHERIQVGPKPSPHIT